MSGAASPWAAGVDSASLQPSDELGAHVPHPAENPPGMIGLKETSKSLGVVVGLRGENQTGMCMSLGLLPCLTNRPRSLNGGTLRRQGSE